ncbi:MAG: HNH endonuclease [Gammaproteobacteria bacterium]|nr:HNH endonuclease [Gammaproteobacteria bacterium]
MRYLRLGIAILFIAGIGTASAYDRADYPHWSDLDDDGLDTREEILVRDSLIDVTYNENGKKVESGLWVCRYTGQVIRDPSALDVDHLVALGEIDAAGANLWPEDQREAFANDPDNLVAVAAGSNRSKRDKDAYLWLPPNIANCSWYLDARAAVWEKYGIEIDGDELKSVKFFSEKCPLHEKGIKLNRVRRWLGTWFDGLF